MTTFRNQSSLTDPALHPIIEERHLEYLKARAVNPGLAKVAGLSSVTKHQAAQLVGWKSLSSGGLAIPYSPEPEKDDHWRIRLDDPIKRPGKKDQRYAAPGGEGARSYVPPFLPKDYWTAVQIPLVIVESPVKALSLMSIDLPSIGLAGVDTGHDSEAWAKGEARLHPELLRRVVWPGRRVVLLFDAGRAINYKVFRAERRLAKAFEAAGAKVFVAELPLTEEGKDQGPDDYLAKHSAEALKKVIDAARPAAEVHDPAEEVIDEINESFAVVAIGGSVKILREIHDPVLARQRLDFLQQKDFELLFKNRQVKASEKFVAAGAHWLRHPRRRTYEQVVLLPGNDNPRYYNLWKGFAVEPRAGDWSLLKAHLKENICRGNEEHYRYLLAFFADGVQNHRRRTGVSLVLKGGEGTGKSIVAKSYGHLFGIHCKTVSQSRHLTGQFNGHLADCLLLVAEEAFWAGDKGAAGVLKDLITGETLNLERKGRDVVTIANLIRVIFCSNENWVVPAGLDARRFLVLDVADTHRQNHPYFAAIDAQMKAGGYEAMLQEILTLDLSGVNLAAIPVTEGLFEQKLFSFSMLEKFWFECLDRGEIVPWRTWEGELLIPTEEIHRAYLEVAGVLGEKRKSSETELGIAVRDLCPGLKRVRRTIAVYKPDPERRGHQITETKKIWCYLLPPLADCRKAFEASLKMPPRNWEDDPEGPSPSQGSEF